MEFSEAWRFSRIPYLEVAFRSAQMNRQSSQSGLGFSRANPEKRIKAIIRSTRISKIIFTVFIGIGSGFPFIQYFMQRSSVALVSAISLSLLISLGYLILFLFQLLPSFSSSEPYLLLSTLPLRESDFSLITFLSFARTFDSQAICAIVVQVTLVVFFTHSVLASLLMFVASCINIAFGITIALYLSRLFYRNMTRGGRSIAASISRFVFLLTWGVAVMSIGFFFDFVTYLSSYVSNAIATNLSHPFGVALSIIHPFSAALVIASSVYPALYGSQGVTSFQVLAYGASTLYVGLGIYAARKTLDIVSSVARGQGVSIIRKATKEYLVKPRTPLFAYLVKDLRMASKSTATAFLFAFPVFEVIIVYFSTSSISRFTSTSVFTSMALGLFFIIFISSALLNTEAASMDYTMSLPLRPTTIVNAKALLVVLTFLPVPIVMLLIEIGKQLSSPFIMFIPFLEIFAVAAAASAQMSRFVIGHRKVILQQSGQSSIAKSIVVFQPTGFSFMGGRDVVRLAISLVIAIGLLIVPIAAYGFSYILTYSHPISVAAMTAAGIVELAIVQLLFRI